ncbi:MAG: N5-carboxyaminoimidazole ribonucleotide synthase [Myxococcota bacterium]|nr:N5-carboxyaminoimidazole ribonucleotide synthase [Myxococcota bacterium]
MTVLPGSTIGVFGGGQLGRMTAMAARAMGYKLRVLDPEQECAARYLVEEVVVAPFDDVVAARWLARRSDVLTFEIETISIACLEAARELTPVRPGPEVLHIVQDKGRQKDWLTSHGFPAGPYRHARDAAEIQAALEELGGKVFVKSCSGGYDGRGQVEITQAGEAGEAFRLLGQRPCIVEKALDLHQELSVLVARNPSGQTVVYPAALNHHENRILAWSLMPGPFAPDLLKTAGEIARGIADQIGLEGLLAVEMFLLHDGRLLVNELAPRTHNTFHSTEVACATSQFEQAVRAVCDLPLGSPQVNRPAAIVNLLGDLWLRPNGPDFHAALAIPGVRLHLYGKNQARPGRKMGHLSATGATPDEAIQRAQQAMDALSGVAR